MNIDTAFDQAQTTINADPEELREARRRRDLFLTVLGRQEDVDRSESFPSGSLARGTQRHPINDVDVIIIYRQASHPDWGQPGPSAGEALAYTGKQINTLMGATSGTDCQEVRLASPRNHAVKCFLDDPDDPDAFTVDVVPALLQPDQTLLIPEKRNKQWVAAHPKDLIARVADRHAEWNQFAKLVRVLKHWNAYANAGMKSLLVEVLALHHLPVADRPTALSRYFTAAVGALDYPVTDPAGLCGEIQPGLDVDTAQARLREAGDLAWQAEALLASGDEQASICTWRRILGDVIPEPPDGCDESPTANGDKFAMPAVVLPRPIRETPQG